jgi:hypothetical protein
MTVRCGHQSLETPEAKIARWQGRRRKKSDRDQTRGGVLGGGKAWYDLLDIAKQQLTSFEE